MKKLILIFSILFTSTFVFARPIVQADFSSFGFMSEIERDAFDKVSPWYGYTAFTPLPIAGIDGSFLWEFDSEVEKKNHFYAGIEAGLFIIGFPVALVGGMNTKLKETETTSLELSTSVLAGAYIEGFYGVPYPFMKAAMDFVIMPKTRKGLYFSPGVSVFMIPMLSYYEGFGIEAAGLSYTSLRFALGYRF